MKEKLLKIINHYGTIPQLKYFQSEVFELTEAIIRHNEDAYPNDIATNNITEEIADVLVMLEQFRLYYNVSTKQVKEIMEYKVNRQLERIKNERN